LSYLYLDSSALLKAYVQEAGSTDVLQAMADFPYVGTSIITKVELAAAFTKLVRIQVLTDEKALFSMDLLLTHWPFFIRLQVSDNVVDRAVALTRRHPLRGYGAVQLASAIVWHEVILHPVTFATFDKRLWQAASEVGLTPFPQDLSPFLSR